MNGEYITIETAKQKAVYDKNLKQKIELEKIRKDALEYAKVLNKKIPCETLINILEDKYE